MNNLFKIIILFLVCSNLLYSDTTDTEVNQNENARIYEKVLQLTLNSDPVHSYLNCSNCDSLSQLIIAEPKDYWNIPAKSVEWCGRPVKFITFDERDKMDSTFSCFSIADYEGDDESALLQLSNKKGKIIITARFEINNEDVCLTVLHIISKAQISSFRPMKYIIFERILVECIVNNEGIAGGFEYSAELNGGRIVIYCEELDNENWLPQICSKGVSVEFVSTGESELDNLKSYFKVVDFEYSSESAILQLFDPKRKMQDFLSFKKIDEEWKLDFYCFEETPY